MILTTINEDTRQYLYKGTDAIAFFVFNNQYYWIIDWEAHFNLNHKKNLDAHLRAGHITKIDYTEALERYRGEIHTLLPNYFVQYSSSEFAKIVTTELLREEFFAEDTGQYQNLSKQIETEISFNTPMQETLVQLRMHLFSLLPKFYINYDRKIFMHMVRGRSYESVVLDGWWGAEGDFEHMIPTSHRYWVRDKDEDFWAITNFSNG